MAHSQWLTTASRALRLYVSTENPPENLQLIVEYILQVYTPMWFKIKRSCDISLAPMHVFKPISKWQKLPSKVRDIVTPVVERNSYGAHLESVSYAMISSTNENHEELAWRRILRCREEKTSSCIRSFRVPKLNMNACSYIEIIDWRDILVSEPVFTASITADEIKKMIVTRKFIDLNVPALPCCHTQSVKRHIKLVTRASSSVCDSSYRDGFILNTLSQERQCHSLIQNLSGYLWRRFQHLWLGGWARVGWDSIPATSTW